MFWMILGHTINWWIRSQDLWIYKLLEMIFSPIGSAGFLFISGLSVAFSYQKKTNGIYGFDQEDFSLVRKEYLYKVILMFFLSFTYNTITLAWLFGIEYIWSWFILQTVAVSLLITWPLLKTSKSFRIMICLMMWVMNQFLFPILSIYEGQVNFYGILFHIFYSFNDQNPILTFSSFFIIGTIIGEKLFEINSIEHIEKRSFEFKKTTLYFLISGFLLISMGSYFSFSEILLRGSPAWNLYAVGIEIILFSVFIYFEEIELFNLKRNYKFLFYYSYYSLSVFLGHNVLYFLFYHQLNIFNIWIATFITFISLGLLMKFIYKKFDRNASLKYYLSKTASYLAKNINFQKKSLGYLQLGGNKFFSH